MRVFCICVHVISIFSINDLIIVCMCDHRNVNYVCIVLLPFNHTAIYSVVIETIYIARYLVVYEYKYVVTAYVFYMLGSDNTACT